MNYYISDLHLFHKNMTKEGRNLDNRPFATLAEMHSVIRKRWNAKIADGDRVYILGDVALGGNRDELVAFVSSLRGHKVLVKGNHDDIEDPEYQALYDEICDYKELKDNLNGESVNLVLSHYPILMWKGQYRGTILLYGHTHNMPEDDYFRKCLDGLNAPEFTYGKTDVKEVRAFNVGCMKPYMDYEPRALSEIALSTV